MENILIKCLIAEQCSINDECISTVNKELIEAVKMWHWSSKLCDVQAIYYIV